MSTEHRNIGEIVSLCKQGDRKSQKTLFEVFSSQMLSLCFRYASSQEDAEDMLIEGFMRAFENIDSYKDNGCDFVFWLRKVMINNCINFLNKQNKESMFTSIDYASEIDET
ncbi:MAG: sigma-70 family RNA polymerase sigma factor, partial [Bacteroidales bacterium]|nr:sigma-70 family RNA polymerase sigma factor [Bacteroidales bacterium]